MTVQVNLPGTLTLSGITVACPEPTNLTLPLNVSGYVSPMGRADMEFEVRKAAANVANTVTYIDYLNSCNLWSSSPTFSSNPINTNGGATWNGGSSGINPFGPPIIGGGVVPIQPNQPVTPNGVPDYSGAGGAGGGGSITAPDQSDYASQFSSRLSLIEEYCDKYGKTVDIDEIRSEYANDPEAGVEYCDDILNNKFNQTLLKKLVHKKYNEYNKTRQAEGASVADGWVKEVLSGGLDKINISSAGASPDNILDVIGAFSVNKDVKNGKVSLDNVFESPEATLQLVELIKSRADEALLDKSVPDNVKKQIESNIIALRENYDKYADSLDDDNKKNDVGFNKVRSALAKNYMELFSILRQDEAKRTDEAAPQYYGLPEDSSIKFNDQTKRANEEISSYKNRRKLSVNI